jgi:modulator of FtsH protease
MNLAYPSLAYATGGWTDFGAAVAASIAALAGLLFIAVSINLKQILEIDGLSTRAAQTLILFATPLVGGLLLAVPGQSRVALGLELLGTGTFVAASQLYLDLHASRTPEQTFWRRFVSLVFPALLSCGCMAVAGATLIGQAGGGLYWLVPSVLSALVFGLINVWVLLVEILR